MQELRRRSAANTSIQRHCALVMCQSVCAGRYTDETTDSGKVIYLRVNHGKYYSHRPSSDGLLHKSNPSMKKRKAAACRCLFLFNPLCSYTHCFETSSPKPSTSIFMNRSHKAFRKVSLLRSLIWVIWTFLVPSFLNVLGQKHRISATFVLGFRYNAKVMSFYEYLRSRVLTRKYGK